MAYLDITVPVRWSDLDGYQHVNNTSFLRLLEEARIRAFWRPSATEQELGAQAYPTALEEFAPGGPYMTFVASNRIEYLRQLDFRREGVIVRLWISKIGTASLDIDYQILAKNALDEPYAKARTVLVIIDTATGRPSRISEHVREVAEQYSGERLEFRE